MPFDTVACTDAAPVVVAPLTGRAPDLLTREALDFIAALHRRFDLARRARLVSRQRMQSCFDAGDLPAFLHETREIREGSWRVAGAPKDLRDRRVEVVGPVDRASVVLALNSEARVFVADFEDATAPTWDNLIEGQANLRDRWAGELFHRDASGALFRLKPRPAALMVRPRGLHLTEPHVLVDGRPVAAALFDFGLYVFHSARSALTLGSGPYLSLAKLESHLEARFWNEVLAFAENRMGLPAGSIRVTVTIETLSAAFEMDEILHEVRERAVGLNCGVSDFIASLIKRLRSRREFLTPDRSTLSTAEGFLNACSVRMIQTCHRRGAHAIGGLCADVPARGGRAANTALYAQVLAEKEREAAEGYDGTSVRHPILAAVAARAFARYMPWPNQLDRLRDDVEVNAQMMLRVEPGVPTEAGVGECIRVCVQYIGAWLRGDGAATIEGQMEGGSGAEVCRSQLWQWLRFRTRLCDGRTLTPRLFERLVAGELAALRARLPQRAYDRGRFEEAAALLTRVCLEEGFEEFLPLPADRFGPARAA